MSPRSSELLAAARDRLAAAIAVIDDSPATALTSAYYGTRAWIVEERGPSRPDTLSRAAIA